MATNLLLTLPPGLSTRAVTLPARAGGRSVTASIVHSGSLPSDDQDKFVHGVETVRQEQWNGRYGDFMKTENDREWGLWGVWATTFHSRTPEPIECVVVTSDGLVQGIMILGPSKEVNEPPKSHLRLLYLAHMATAPWNRKKFPASIGDPEALKRVGTELIKEAVCLSIAYGHGGRLGLRAMGRSGAFYESQGFKNLGKRVKYDAFPGHDWYELTDQLVARFLSANGPCP
jgi:hypothetical protein